MEFQVTLNNNPEKYKDLVYKVYGVSEDSGFTYFLIYDKIKNEWGWVNCNKTTPV